MSTLDEEKKRKITERRAAAEKAQQNLDKYGISTTELTNKSNASPVSGSKPATTKQEYAKQANAAAQAIKGTARVADSNDYRNWLAQPKTSSAYVKKNAGDNDMNVVQSMYRQEEVDPAAMTLDQAMGFATRIVDDKERDSFLKLYRKSAGNKRSANYVEDLPTLDEMRGQLNTQKPGGIYQSAGKKYSKGIQEQFARDYKNAQNMKSLGGLYDANGNAININTADYATVVQGIRSIVDSDKRNAAIASLKELAKTEGSRFYGQTIDEKLLKTYLGNPDFTQADYDDFVEGFEDSFYPQDGYDEENAATYWDFYDEIEASGYSEDIRRQLRDRLDTAFKNSTGKNTPVRAESIEEEPVEAEDAAQKEDKPSLLEKVGDAVGGFVDGVADSITRPYTEKPDDEGSKPATRTPPSWIRNNEEPPAPPSGWLKNDGMPDMSSATRLASAGRSDSESPIPRNEAEVYGPQQRFTSSPYIKDDADVVGAILKGGYSNLDKADTQVVDGFMQYKTARQIIGTVVDPNAVADVTGNNRGAENVVRENYGMLGEKASMALEVLMGEEYPAELRNDGILILMELGAKAEQLAENGMLGGDESLPLLERLLTTDSDALAELNAIYSARDELVKARAEQLEAENLENLKKLAESREAVLKGEYSDEQLAMVQKYAPDVKLSDMASDYRRAELGGLIDDWAYGFFAEEYEPGADGYIRFKDTAVYANLEANGVIDKVDYLSALNGQMHNVIDEDTRTAMSLGLTLQEYYARIGGMTEEGICQRAATRIAQYGGMMTEEGMQNLVEYGDGVNAVEWTSATVGKGTVELFGNYADSLYVGMSEANVVRTAGRMQVEYQDEFGDLLGRDYYRRDLERLLESGTLPEGMAVSLRRAMIESIDIYQVGIDPEALGGLRTAGSKARDIVKQVDRFMQENATEGQYKWYQRGASMVKNAEQALISMGVGKAVGTALSAYATTEKGLALANRIAGHAGFTAGYDVPGWNAYYEDAVLNKHLPGRSAAYIASFKTGINHASNYVTYSKIAGQVSKLVGLDSIVKGAVSDAIQSNAVSAFKAFADTHAFVKGVVTFIANEANEVIDEFKEGMGESYIDNAIVPLFQKAENGEKITASDVIKAVLVVPAADVVGNAWETFKNIPEIAITSSLFAFAGAAGEATETYNSVKMASDIVHGKSNDVGAFVEAARQDLQDEQFCAAVDSVAEQAREDEAVAVELMTDDGSDGLMEREREANEQADAHAEKKEAAAAGMQAAQETMTAVQEKVDSGTADDTDVQMLTDAQEAYVKDKTSFEEAEREEMQKREEAKRLRTEKYRNAKTAAKTRLAQQDAEIAENMLATMEQRKAQAEAAQLEQERSNVVALEAENFVNDRYSGASEEDQQTARDAYIESAGNKVDADFKMVDATVRQFQKKFSSITFKVVDTLGGAEGGYVSDTNSVYIARDMTQGEIAKRVLVHELTHASEGGGEAYQQLQDALLEIHYKGDVDRIKADVLSKQKQYNDHFVKNKIVDEATGKTKQLTRQEAMQEIVAEINSELISGNEDLVKRLVEKQPSVARRVWETIKDFLQKVGVMKVAEIDQLRKVEKMFENALNEAQTQKRDFGSDGMQYSMREAQPVADSPETGEPLVGEVKGATMQYSLRTWTEDERKTVREKLINRGHAAFDVEKWINDVDSAARVIADNKARLDFEAADNQVMLKPNQEYVKTLDASTLCAKRLLYQGTFNAIQHAMPDHVFSSEELLDLLNLMKEEGYETPCGVCYVESRRRHLGKFADQWLHGRPASKNQKAWEPYSGDYIPSIDELTTTDGLENLRKEHPEAYDSFMKRMNSLGSGNPKVVQLRTDYRGDIRKMAKSQIEKVVRIGGLRVQSFSDFETPHLLDMMQAVLDMSAMGLTSQAYTKVPNFAWAFGDTGIKINLSLMAEGSGVDENGNLIFSSSEGMDIKDALALRDRYSKNVGTIIVGANDAHIRAAMVDPRIDYIIPFHKSGWGENELRKVNVLQTYDDYEAYQNERIITGYSKNGKPEYGRPEGGNFYPIDYWDYSKSGDENAKTYLRMCEEDGRVPKFEQFLTKDAEGHWVAPSGYWKMLIDFKMYDNDGVGAPQEVVQPEFNMDEAMRILDEYKGGANELPVANDIVQKFADRYKGMQFSVRRMQDGAEYVSVDTDQDIFEGHDVSDFPAIAKNYIKERFRGKVIGDERNRAYVDAKTGNEYTHPAKRLDDDAFDGKMRAATELDNLVKTGVYIKNTGPEKRHPEFPGGFDLYDAVFEVSGKFFEGRLNIGIDANGRRRLYDMTKIKSLDPEVWVKQHGGVAAHGAHQSSNDSLPQSGMPFKGKLSLPSKDVLNGEIESYRALQNQPEPEAEQAQEIPRQTQRPMGERQFTTKTMQESQAVPQWIKDTLYNDPNARFYEKDTNDEQIVRSMNRLQEEGYEAMRDRVLRGNADSADNVADANLILAVANRDGDVQTFLDVAARYAAEGTETAKTLQARKIFSRMTPTGMKVWAAGQMENNLSDFVSKHQPMRRQVDARAKKVADSIKDLQGGDELLRLQAASEYTITDENNRWGVPINQKQQALIDHYKLNKVARPGDAYNRATLKQRMLEAILAEPNPENVTGQGLNLIQRLEYAMEGAPVIFNSDLDYMGSQMALYAHSPVDDQDGRVGDLALARLYEAYGNITPATGGEKRRTWRYTSTLLSVPSAGRNVIGNAAQGGVNAVSHGVAQALDSLVSLGTGKRTVAGLSVKERVDGWRAFTEETKNTFRDFYVDKAITSHGEDRHNLNQRGRVFESNALEALRLTEGFLMSVGDRNFWKKAYVNSLAEQQRVAEMNGEEFDYDAACERAEAEANYATFNEDSRVRELLTRLKNPPEDASEFSHMLAAAIDYLMPFTGVPTNITKRMIQYSPAGLLVSALKHGRRALNKANFDQYQFVTDMSRGLTGTALFAIGGALLEAGLLSLGTGEEDDKKIYGAETAQGRQYTPYIRIGDQYISLSTFMPAGSALIMGATAADVFKDDEDVWNAIKSACFSSLDMIFDASYMSALADVFGGYGSLGENAVNSLINSTVSMNVPAMLGQIASALDPYVRDTKDKNAIMQALKSGLIAKIPGLRTQLLEAKVDITGEKVVNSKYVVAPVDPFTRSYANDDETLQYLIDHAREYGDSSVIPELFVKSNKYEVNITKTQAKSLRINRGMGANGKTEYRAMDIAVTDEEKWALNEEYGKAVFAEIRELMSNVRWKRWDAEQRAEEINKVIKETKLDVLENFVKKRGIE